VFTAAVCSAITWNLSSLASTAYGLLLSRVLVTGWFVEALDCGVALFDSWLIDQSLNWIDGSYHRLAELTAQEVWLKSNLFSFASKRCQNIERKSILKHQSVSMWLLNLPLKEIGAGYWGIPGVTDSGGCIAFWSKIGSVMSPQHRPMTFGTAPRNDYGHTTHPENSPMKPKVVTVVRAGPTRPRKKITILLNRRAVSFGVFFDT